MRQSLELNAIRTTLAIMEDSIIFNLFRRSQYPTNSLIYTPGGVPITNFNGSFLDYLLKGRESLDATAGRYDDRREHPFFSLNRVYKKVARTREEDEIAPPRVNRNADIKKAYIGAIKEICKEGDDNEYGSCAILDINCLQELSNRVHLGEFVAESKFRKDRQIIEPLLKTDNVDGLVEALRDKTVELRVYERVKEKGKRYNLNPEFIGSFYVNQIIPLTIEVEVEYLRTRTERGN